VNKQSPVDSSPVAVVVAIREDLAEFKRTSSKEALRAEWKAACQADLLQAASRRSSDSVPDSWLRDYLDERGLLRQPKRRQRPKLKK